MLRFPGLHLRVLPVIQLIVSGKAIITRLNTMIRRDSRCISVQAMSLDVITFRKIVWYV
jgi:hypothetical protein